MLEPALACDGLLVGQLSSGMQWCMSASYQPDGRVLPQASSGTAQQHLRSHALDSQASTDDQGPAAYQVVLFTSDLRGAGTNGSVFVTLHGAEGEGQQHLIFNDGSRFDRCGQLILALVT